MVENSWYTVQYGRMHTKTAATRKANQRQNRQLINCRSYRKKKQWHHGMWAMEGGERTTGRRDRLPIAEGNSLPKGQGTAYQLQEWEGKLTSDRKGQLTSGMRDSLPKAGADWTAYQCQDSWGWQEGQLTSFRRDSLSMAGETEQK